MSTEHYRPLPDGVTIKASAIEGLGLFATKAFSKGHDFGVTHIQDDRFPDGYIRTPLGGFYNHTDTPNCEAREEGTMRRLVAVRDIAAGEELTATYTLYQPDQAAG